MPSQRSQDREVVETNNTPDYLDVEIPSKPPTSFSYVQRRAELLEQIMSLGHPSMIHQGEQADRYGVSQSQISKDISRLAEYIDDNLGSRRGLATEAVYRRCITGLLEEGEYRKAAQTVGEWNEWIDTRKDREEFEERIAALEQQQ